MATVKLNGTIRFAACDLSRVLAELPSHIDLTRAAPGCQKFEVDVDPNDSALFHVSEVFSDPESFVNHQARVGTSTWGLITKHAEREYTIEGLPD